MRCAKIRNLLAADYIDGELGESTQKEIAGHLDNCLPCRLYEEAVRRVAVDPFREAKTVCPPEHVWQEIRRRIAREKADGSRAARGRGLFSFLRAREVALAAAAAALILVVCLFRLPSSPTTGTQPTAYDTSEVQEYIREQFIALSYLGGNGGGSAAEGGNGYFGIASVDFGTAVEEYLL